MSWKTRKRGTSIQRGTHFLVGGKRRLPKLSLKKAKIPHWIKSRMKGYNICPECGQAFGEGLRDLEKYKEHWKEEHAKMKRALKGSKTKKK